MISLEGIVTKCSLVRPKVVKSVHYCEEEDRFFFREYRDQTTSAGAAATSSVYPTEDEEKHPVCVTYLVKISLLIPFSSSPNMDIARTETIKQSPSRKCQRGHQLDNYQDL